jgi:uncharacterized protein (UPF0371 family)
MKTFFACIALSLGFATTVVQANPSCDECRRAAERTAQACESAATSEMRRQICRTGLRQALGRCDQTKCKQTAPIADACGQCRKDVQLKAQACQSAARNQAERDACTAAMKEGDAACGQRFCQKG